MQILDIIIINENKTVSNQYPVHIDVTNGVAQDFPVFSALLCLNTSILSTSIT